MVEAVIKMGGSLAENLFTMEKLARTLKVLSRTHKILLIPGGGKFADTVREYDERFHLSRPITHKMAILAMDQYGLFLLDKIKDSIPVYRLGKLRGLCNIGCLPLFFPSNFLFSKSSLKSSWDVTSDSISAYVAILLKAKKLILTTDVDGIYEDDPKTKPNARFFDELSIQKLSAFKSRTSVDRYLPKVLKGSKIDCYVVNGKYPKRIRRILENRPTTCTRIRIR
ncbi:MAG: hypothetical protein ABIH76_07630 [Candidatus Bathyarchaeota archaeon]